MASTSTLVTNKDEIGIVNAGINGPIRICGTQQAQQAIREFSKYGLISFSRDQRFKSSDYSIHFIKPAKKLKELYNLGDEVLILCCNNSLAEFKSRTKDFLDFLLSSKEEFKNRLDKVACFVVDDSEKAEDIIRFDRAQNPDSRLIVPFSYAELNNGLTDELLQARLRAFLYERDLFGIAAPLQDENLFFGKDRTNLISELYGKYRQGEHGGLFGLRRIGKTSILNLLRQRVDQSGGVAIYLDCSKYHHQRWNTFLQQIIIDVEKRYRDKDSGLCYVLAEDFVLPTDPSRYEESKAPISFEEDILSLYNALGKTRILLIFDEIELIGYTTSPSEHWKNGSDALFFWQAIRSVFQTNSSVLSFIITGVNPKIIEIAKINGTDNPIFNGLSAQYISLFDLDDVRRMVSNIGGYLGLRFEEEIFTKFVDDYGGHPFLIRQVCSRMNTEVLDRRGIRPYTISKYSYEKHSNDYQSQMTGVIEQILGVLQDYYPAEYELLKTLALDGSLAFKKKLGFGESAAAHLLGYCLIEKYDDDYFVRIQSISKYIKDKYRYDKSLTSWEEKRTRISIRRNDIELKLREIISTQFQLKFGKKAKEHLATQLRNTTTDTTQETKILSRDFKSAMQEIYFSQLKTLVTKNWSDYERLFNDRVKFEQFFDIVNSFRADAHAKELSEEDEAILNIAFKYFENALKDF